MMKKNKPNDLYKNSDYEDSLQASSGNSFFN